MVAALLAGAFAQFILGRGCGGLFVDSLALASHLHGEIEVSEVTCSLSARLKRKRALAFTTW